MCCVWLSLLSAYQQATNTKVERVDGRLLDWHGLAPLPESSSTGTRLDESPTHSRRESLSWHRGLISNGLSWLHSVLSTENAEGGEVPGAWVEGRKERETPRAWVEDRKERETPGTPDIAHSEPKEPSTPKSDESARRFASDLAGTTGSTEAPSNEVGLSIQDRVDALRAQNAGVVAEQNAKTQAALEQALSIFGPKKLVQSPATKPTSPLETRPDPSRKPVTPSSGTGTLASSGYPYLSDPYEDDEELSTQPAEEKAAQGPAPVEPAIPSGQGYSAAVQSTDSTTESVSAEQDLPKCTPANPNVWPFDSHPFNKRPEGFSRPKVFPGYKCPCGGEHPAEHCFTCRQMREVWRMKGDGTGTCKKCNGRVGHTDAEHGLGEFRDHPENPSLPAQLKKYARPWPKTHRKQPLPKYYYLPKNSQPGRGNPGLSDQFRDGLPCGLFDKKFNLKWSLADAERIASGSKVRVPFTEKIHGPLMHPPKHPRGKEVAPKSDQDQKPPKQAPTVDKDGFTPVQGGATSSDAGFGGLLRYNSKCPTPGYRRGMAKWFEADFEAAIRKCLEPFHAKHLGLLKSNWAGATALLASSPEDLPLRERVRQAVADAWDIYVVYIPHFVPSKEWSLPEEIVPWIESEKARLVNETGSAARQRPVDVQDNACKDFAWVAKTGGKWSEVYTEDGFEYTAEESDHPQLTPQTEEAAETHFRKWAEDTALQLHETLLPRYAEFCSQKKETAVKELELFKKKLEEAGHQPADLEKILDDYQRTWGELSTTLAEAARWVHEKSIALDLESFKEARTQMVEAFEDCEKKYSQTLSCAFPEEGKGIGHILETIAGKESEIMNTLLGGHLPARDVNCCQLPRLAWPCAFLDTLPAEAAQDDEYSGEEYNSQAEGGYDDASLPADPVQGGNDPGQVYAPQGYTDFGGSNLFADEQAPEVNVPNGW